MLQRTPLSQGDVKHLPMSLSMIEPLDFDLTLAGMPDHYTVERRARRCPWPTYHPKTLPTTCVGMGEDTVGQRREVVGGVDVTACGAHGVGDGLPQGLVTIYLIAASSGAGSAGYSKSAALSFWQVGMGGSFSSTIPLPFRGTVEWPTHRARAAYP